MRNTLLRLGSGVFIGITLLACGGDSADEGVAAIRTASASDDPRCASVLDQSGALYPARWVPSPAERERFSSQAEEFRAFHGADAALYTLEAKEATTSATIMRRGAGDGSGIRIADGTLGSSTMERVTADFLMRWKGFINPYDVELTFEEPFLDGPYVQRNLTQSFCGLAVRGSQDYGGTVNLTAYQSNSTLLWVQSSLVPLVPLPAPALDASDAVLALVGEELDGGCSRQRVTPAACQTVDPRLVVFVSSVAGALEYRLAYEVELHTDSCSPDASTWTVNMDAMDGSILAVGSDVICPAE